MRKAIVLLMLILVLGTVNIYSVTNSRNISSTTLSADDSRKTTVDPAPNTDTNLLDISINKGME